MRDITNVISVARLLEGVHSLGFMRKFILNRSCINVSCVSRLLENGLTLVFDKEFILERNLTNDMSV